ncbi:MAG: ABC transporter ATP-binding protein [Candidatus Delongbacteria bacterium]|nr:ABC transporter ATP-binding protein [Candidatus Delongbacteria bacterium]
MNVIEAKDLTKHYSGKVKALDKFSIEVEKGKVFSLLGPNGAGKTTFIKLMLSIVKPTSGAATILGSNINDPLSRKKIGYLSENHVFPDYLNAEQILFYYGMMANVAKSDIKKRIPVLLSKVKLSDKKNIKIKKFSKGMLQRLGTAQALINDPEIIFLDEPTDGIDPIGRIEIREILNELRNEGKTIFINSHLLSEVERISDEIAILKDGKLIKRGKLENFINDTGSYRIKLVGSKNDLIEEYARSKNIEVNFEKGYYKLGSNDLTQLNKLIDELRSNEIMISEISPIKETLEDYFIKIIGEN